MVEEKHVHFGLAIKNARINCDLTQEQLSERASITCRYLIAIENEGKIPKYPVIYRLIHAMHISADRVFYPEQPQVPRLPIHSPCPHPSLLHRPGNV